jgi:radical SAM superfamily enzyme YgiQ (UPF0313 family)
MTNPMKKIGIITLTRQNSLAYSALRRIVDDLGYKPICGEAIGADCIYFPLEEINLVGYDFLADFFKKAGLKEADIILISAPYTVNLFMLPKVIWCLRSIKPAPIILGGNEASNNYKNLMLCRFSTFVNKVVDIAPDFIVRGAAENVLDKLLPLLKSTTMTDKWDKKFLKQILQIPNIVFWLPQRKALMATEFFCEELSERNIFSYVKYGEKSIAITLQRACLWAKKSRGGCLFCAIAGQFGTDFHCAVQSDFFLEDLCAFLKKNPQIKNIDIWDDTFNINEEWTTKICGYLKALCKKAERKIRFTVFLRPKGLTEKLVKEMAEANIRVAFIGADALTEELSKRLRRGCTVSEMNTSIEALGKGKILPRLSVQLFSPESTIDDVGITATLALGCINDGESTVHVHLYTFPLYGSDIYRLLKARDNLKKIPTPLLRMDNNTGFEPCLIAYDYKIYDPDVEEIKRKTFKLLGISTSPKKKSLWFMTILHQEDRGSGLTKSELLNFLSKNETVNNIPEQLRKTYGNFGYQFALSRSVDEVMAVLVQNNWVRKTEINRYCLLLEGKKNLQSIIKKEKAPRLSIAAYGEIDTTQLMISLESELNKTHPRSG